MRRDELKVLAWEEPRYETTSDTCSIQHEKVKTQGVFFVKYSQRIKSLSFFEKCIFVELAAFL